MMWFPILFIVTGWGVSAHGEVSQEQRLDKGFNITSSAFTNGGAIPVWYTCDGANVFPDLKWSSEPAGTQSFALIVDDPDALPKEWVHWIVYNMPATVKELPTGTDTEIFVFGKNDFGHTVYGGPCPSDDRTHHYRFTLYALDTQLPQVRSIETKKRLLARMRGHILGQTTLVGTYTRLTR